MSEAPKCPHCGEQGWADVHIRMDDYIECLICGHFAYEDSFYLGTEERQLVTPVTTERLQQLWDGYERQRRKTRSTWEYVKDGWV